jgi:transmembrane sensor
MTRRDFKRAIAAAKTELGRIEMPTPAAARVLRNVKRRGRGGPALALGGLALAGACAAIFVVVGRGRHGAPPMAPAVMAARLPAGFETVGGTPDLQLDVAGAGTTIAVRRGSCTLRVHAWGAVTLRAGAAFRPIDGGVELSRGEADFVVDKRPPGAAATFVRGPQGTIEITGTRFTVIQRSDGGTVRLDEGAIRFRAPDGRTVALVPGQSLSWPLPPAASPRVTKTVRASMRATRAAPAFRQAERTAPVDPSEALVDRIAALRAERRYDEVTRELRAALVGEARPLTRERLSFELGSVLSYHLLDREAACAHWAGHRRAFAAGRYEQEVADIEKVLRCTPPAGGGP